MRYFSRLLMAICIAFTLASPIMAAEQLVISEFMASNESSHADEDLYYYPDWVELFNAGDVTVNLQGWHLTDDSGLPFRWAFPEKEINPGEFLVVFCSGKDRSDPDGELHTNFELQAGGEYLGLIRPDGTAASEYRPFYPRQEIDISYGLKMASEVTSLVGDNSPATILIPTDDSLGTTWTDPGFDDAAWMAGPVPVGYDTKSTGSYDDIINTDLEVQLKGVNPSVYIRVPFNLSGDESFNFIKLTVQYDDGYIAYMNGTEVGRANAREDSTWDSTATATRSSTDELIISGDLLSAGNNVLAFHSLNRSANNIDLLINPVMEAVTILDIDPDNQFFFSEPTPGQTNAEGFPAIAERPRPSHPPGGFSDPFLLTLQADSPNAEIRYITNHRDVPDENDTLFVDPININKTMEVRARVYEPGKLPGPVVSFCYMMLDSSVMNFDSDLPVMVINQLGSQINQFNYASTHLFVFDRQNQRNALTEFAPFNTRAGVKWRGSSSLNFAKKMYSLELWNENDREFQANLLGLPSRLDAGESDWVLYAPYSDKSLMRNVLSYEWSNEIGRYAPRTQWFELFLNASTGAVRYPSNYMGVYVLVEKIKRGRDRVDLDPLYATDDSEPEISGGYILKNDRLDDGDAGFSTSRVSLCYVYPKERQQANRPPQIVITNPQKTWIRNYLIQFENALYGANFRDPVNGYNKYIDAASFVDHHIMVEMTKNIDGYRLSTFMFKDKGGKLNMGPIWDYNLSLGNADYNGGWLTTGWYYSIYSKPVTQANDQYPWYDRLFQDPDFQALYSQRWFEHRAGALATEQLLGDVDRHADHIREAQARNFQKWRVLGIRLWPNWYIAPTWEAEITWMKNWITERVAWIDSQYLSAPRFSDSGGMVDPGHQVSMTTTMGEVYYTINGPDPEDAWPDAILYDGPITINENTRIRAKTKAGGSWSTLSEATFVIELPKLVITEIMYNPATPPDSPFLGRDFEFIEVQNVGDKAISLVGAEFTRGVTFSFVDGQVQELGPGEFVVIVRNLEAFSWLYDTSTMKVAGQWSGTLSDSRETVTLTGPLGEAILSFRYEDDWAPQTDGGGYSLVIKDSRAPLETWELGTSWRRSSEEYGSPGREDPEMPNGYQVQGDINQDGRLGLADVISLLNYLFGQNPVELPCFQDSGNQILLDVSIDGSINLGDAVYLLTYLYNDGPAPIFGDDCVIIEGCPDVCTP